MSDIDPLTGLPKDLGVIENISKEKQAIRIRVDRRRYGKAMTVVEGFDSSVDVKALAKQLKSRLATGGTLKGRSIELQGDQRERVKAALIKMGYPEGGIDVK
jgi:translation initiation factor 1|tara:strand:- start:233 stop:538 length:306 start_codon:yes stop_codon:yes gene_type:complete